MPSELKKSALETGMNPRAAFALIELEPETARRPGTSATRTANPRRRFI
jgi:hypothetical protein